MSGRHKIPNSKTNPTEIHLGQLSIITGNVKPERPRLRLELSKNCPRSILLAISQILTSFTISLNLTHRHYAEIGVIHRNEGHYMPSCK